MSGSERIPAERLREFTIELFQALDTPADIAAVVANHLASADLKGMASHGTMQVLAYVRSIEGGTLHPQARPQVIRETKSTVSVDGNQGFGHYTAWWAMDLAMRRARETGMCAVSLRRTHHIGRLGTYAEKAAAKGYVSLIAYGAGGPGLDTGPDRPRSEALRDLLAFGSANAAPFGGARAVLHSNPICFGCPSGDGRHFVADFATQMLANAKVLMSFLKGEELAPGCIIDADGNPSVDPADYYRGGAPLVFGGYKGYAFALLTCLLGGLSGAYNAETCHMGGQFLMAIDIRAFQPLEVFERNVAALLDGMRSLPSADGFREVLVPGDPELHAEERNRRDGVRIPAEVLAELDECCRKYGVYL